MNIKDYLPFYLGCSVYIPSIEEDIEMWEDYTLLSVSQFNCTIANPRFGISDFNHEEVKPILRPLSDITDQEKDEERKIWNSALIYPDPFTEIKKTIADAKSTQYLLSKQLDVFGLIDAGLAIDKTKLNNQ